MDKNPSIPSESAIGKGGPLFPSCRALSLCHSTKSASQPRRSEDSNKRKNEYGTARSNANVEPRELLSVDQSDTNPDMHQTISLEEACAQIHLRIAKYTYKMTRTALFSTDKAQNSAPIRKLFSGKRRQYPAPENVSPGMARADVTQMSTAVRASDVRDSRIHASAINTSGIERTVILFSTISNSCIT